MARSASSDRQPVRLLLRKELPFVGRGQSSHFDPDVWSGRASQEVFVELAVNGLASMGPGRVKTRSVLLVGGVSGDPGRIARLGAANSAESVREDA
jgi:hypothetical protein